MKALVFAMVLLACLPLSAQNSPAAAAAAREEMEERWKQLQSDIQSLLATQQSQQRKINALFEEIKALREEKSKTDNRYASQEEVRHLTEKLAEVEKKRLADRDAIIDQIKQMGKLIGSSGGPSTPSSHSPPVKPGPSSSPSSNTNGSNSTPIPDKGYEHVVKARETLSAIITAYRENGVKVSLKQVLDANEGLQPGNLKVGQKIFIPDYSK